jgi:hypothetical protein
MIFYYIIYNKFKKILYLKDMDYVMASIFLIAWESIVADLPVFAVIIVWNLFVLLFISKKYIKNESMGRYCRHARVLHNNRCKNGVCRNFCRNIMFTCGTNRKHRRQYHSANNWSVNPARCSLLFPFFNCFSLLIFNQTGIFIHISQLFSFLISLLIFSF